MVTVVAVVAAVAVTAVAVVAAVVVVITMTMVETVTIRPNSKRSRSVWKQLWKILVSKNKIQLS
jgi:hypothetical protein